MQKNDEQILLKEFGGRLATLRRSKGYTQEHLASILNISLRSYTFIETGKRWPRLKTIHIIAQALDAEVYELFGAPKY